MEDNKKIKLAEKAGYKFLRDAPGAIQGSRSNSQEYIQEIVKKMYPSYTFKTLKYTIPQHMPDFPDNKGGWDLGAVVYQYRIFGKPRQNKQVARKKR